MNAPPPPGKTPWGALLSLFGTHLVCGYEFGSHMLIPNHGAMLSSNQWVTSWPGWLVVGMAFGSIGRRSVNDTLLPEPGRLEMKRMDGSSWPM